MKKLLAITFLTLSLLLLVWPVSAATEEEPAKNDAGAFYEENSCLKIEYGDKNVKCKNAAIKSGDLTYLPLREVLNAYGLEVAWAKGEAEDKVIVTADGKRFQLVVDQKKSIAQGLDKETYSMKQEEGTLYLPVHFYADLVNCSTSWNPETQVLAFNEADKKEGAKIINVKDGSVTYKKVMNLPDYKKSVPPTVSRTEGPEKRPESSGKVFERGTASYYGKGAHGNLTASGERFDMNALTAAHKTLPFGTIVRVKADWNGKTVDVRITDRGPFGPGRVIDLSSAAASKIGMLSRGIGPVTLEVISYP